MWKYIRLNLFVVSKRVSTYLIPVIFVFILFCVTGLISMLGDSSAHKSSITHTSKSFLVLPFIVMIVFVSTKVLNIFKDPETDGTELMIASKPITRTKIIFGKFLTLYILIGLFSLFTFLCSLLIAQADKYASSSEVLTFSLSMGFGTWIISMLLSAIVIFFASTMGKIGTTVCSLLVPLIFALTSTTITGFVKLPLTRDGGTSGGNFVQNTYKIKNNKIFIQKTSPSFMPDGPDVSASNDPYNMTLEQQYKTHEAHWYQYAAYADVWNQLTTFYFMFNKSEPSITDADYKYRVSTSAKASDVISDEFKVKVRRHTYFWKKTSQYKHSWETYKNSKHETVYADVVYKLEAMNTYGHPSERDIEKQKNMESALTVARTEYKNSDSITKSTIKSIFELWAHQFETNQDLSDKTSAAKQELIRAIPKFFGRYIPNVNSKEYDSEEEVTSTLFNYLLLLSLKDGLSTSARSALLSSQGRPFSSELHPVGVETKEQKSSKSSLTDRMSGYDRAIFTSEKPYQEATIKKLVPSKYVPDLLVYLAWPAFTLLMSALIILRYMKRDFR